MRRKAALAALCSSWLAAAAFAPPDAPRLDYETDGLLVSSLAHSASAQPVEPGEQYPPPQDDRRAAPEPSPPRPAAGKGSGGASWTLTVDASVIADSNVTNGTDSETVLVETGEGRLPVPLDPNLREKAGVGLGLSASGGLRLPLDDSVALAVDAEGYAVQYEGTRSDDSALLLAAGAELRGEDGRGSIQAMAFERWYGGLSAYRGLGVRGRYRHEVGKGEHVGLSVDARIFESGYGEEYGGRQASAYLTYDSVLSSDLSMSGGLFARREWLESDPFSSLELGIYGGLSHYLSDDLSAGLSAGVSRLTFDGVVPSLSPDPREDWRLYASLYLTTRKPVALGLFPSLTYSYNRTDSSIGYYRADRHRLRLGILRNF